MKPGAKQTPMLYVMPAEHFSVVDRKFTTVVVESKAEKKGRQGAAKVKA